MVGVLRRVWSWLSQVGTLRCADDSVVFTLCQIAREMERTGDLQQAARSLESIGFHEAAKRIREAPSVRQAVDNLYDLASAIAIPPVPY